MKSYDSIPATEQGNVMAMYWLLMRSEEERALDSKDILDMRAVEAAYRLWNRVTGEDKKPYWIK